MKATAVATSTARRAVRSPATSVTAAATTKSAAMLDCE
jgi:hypothetical protein